MAIKDKAAAEPNDRQDQAGQGADGAPAGTVQAVRAPDLEWLEGGIPRSSRFQDTYFSKAGGLAETRHVFLAGNGLPGRWQGREAFTVGELGFGTGLNFLTTLDALCGCDPAPRLTFLSFELFPLTRLQLETALVAWPELRPVAEDLIAAWKPRPGWNRWRVGGHSLILGVGDARALMGEAGAQLPGAVDAWFLDGFAPARNPELWGEGLLRAVFALTLPGGTLATYTAAGWVRRNLQAAGFQIAKVRGFAGKREMVVGGRPSPQGQGT